MTGLDTITILETRENLVAAKRIRLRPGQEPEIVGYDSPKHFTIHERQIESIFAATELLSKIERAPRRMMIRGRVRNGVDRSNARRTYVNGGDEAPCFDAAAHNLIMLDFDKIDCPAGLDPLADPAAAVRIAVGLLPVEFYGVTVWWQFTSSAGLKPGIRLRLAYWGSRPTTDQELKDWLPDVVDHSIFTPVQPIYVANPIFESGDDPVPVRSGIIRGDRDEVAIPDTIEPVGDVGDGLGYTGYCALIGDHPGGKGFNIPIGKAIAAWIGKHGAKKPTDWLRKDLERVILAANATRHSRGDIEEKIASLDRRIEWTRQREAQKPQKQSQGEAAAAIAAGAELFHNPDGDAFVDIEVRGHRETYPVRSKAFKQWLSLEFYRANGKPPAADAVKQALSLTEGRARYEAPERDVHLRVARVGERIYLDLADDGWRAVEVDANGWRVVDRPPVRFRRTAGTLPLPEPRRGGDVKELKPFVNVDDDGFVVAVAWQLAALGGVGPYPVLDINGEHGSAKTSAGKFCRRVIDPNTVLSRGPPRSDRDLYVAAHNSACVHFENISKLPDWLSDALCRIATGGGFATRQLYENTDEVLFRGMRPLILDGIENFVERADLADRAIKLSLDKVPEEKRRGEKQLDQEFAEKHPAILGALLDAVSHGLAELPNIRLEALPRMADFAIWATACEGALWEKGTFKRVYDKNRETMMIDTIEGDLVADAVRRFMREKPWNHVFDAKVQPTPVDHWIGSAGDLLTHIESGIDLKTILRTEWPKNARALSARLRRIREGLQKVGIDVRLGNDNDRRIQVWPVNDVPF